MIRLLGMLAAAGAVTAADAPHDYLAKQPMPDLMRVLPPPPATGSPRDIDDRDTFRATRPLLGTRRGDMATGDVSDDRFIVFSCAMGRTIPAGGYPALHRVFAQAGDRGMTGHAKEGFAVRRPYLKEDLPICEPKTAHLAGNGDYPSGHASSGWSTALILAELMPDRATAILRRGRQYGESRFICGSHSRSAVEAGFLAGSSLVALLHASARFRRDMEAARRELARAAAGPAPSAARCARESSAGAAAVEQAGKPAR